MNYYKLHLDLPKGSEISDPVIFSHYPKTIRKALSIPENELILCGMALGHADPDAPENLLVTEREPMDNFTDFRGF